MLPPDELMIQEFLPAIRQLVSKQLRSQGFSQNRISSLLGVTQASVSLYLASASDRSYSALSSLSLSTEEADRYASLLAEDVKRNAVDAVGTLSTVWTGLLGRGAVCAMHRSLYPTLSDCDVCVRNYEKDGSAFSEAISQVAEAIKILETVPGFASVMPEVSVNIALAVGEAKSVADVVAVPGRIVRVKGRPHAILPPEPGASTHLSKVLLLLRIRKPESRACINLRYNERMAAVLRGLGLKALKIGGYAPSGPTDPTVNALEKRLRSAKGDSFDVLVDLGGTKIEPNVYLLGADARGVANLAARVARAYLMG